MTKTLDIFTATMLAEGCYDLAGYDADEVTEELQVEAWQLLIDTGVVWQLQGSFGRMAAAMIEEGVCTNG
jgi:hypothetical protein